MEQKQFTQQELDGIKSLQAKYSDLGIQLVQLKLALKNAKEYVVQLTEQEEELTNQIVEANKAERDLAQSLNEKYGIGSLDMETGIFIPNSEKN